MTFFYCHDHSLYTIVRTTDTSPVPLHARFGIYMVWIILGRARVLLNLLWVCSNLLLVLGE